MLSSSWPVKESTAVYVIIDSGKFYCLSQIKVYVQKTTVNIYLFCKSYTTILGQQCLLLGVTLFCSAIFGQSQSKRQHKSVNLKSQGLQIF